MISTDKIKGHIAVILANVFFGMNVPLTKDLMATWLTPTEYIISRVGFAMMIFWIIGLFTHKEKVTGKDKLYLFLGGLFGVVSAQMLVAVSLDYTSPIYSSLFSALSPAIVMFLAYIFLHEPITHHKATGVIIGVAGAALLISHIPAVNGNETFIGIVFAIASVTSYAIYLIIIRTVANKYSPLTQMKWTYLSASLILIPVACVMLPKQKNIFPETGTAQYCELAFIIVFATVIAFMLIPYGLKYLRPTTVSVYINLQPVVAASVSIILGQDSFSWEKPIAGLLVIIGAYIVTTSPARKTVIKTSTI